MIKKTYIPNFQYGKKDMTNKMPYRI